VHMQAMRSHDGDFWHGAPVPMLFDGRFLVRNQVFSTRKPPVLSAASQGLLRRRRQLHGRPELDRLGAFPVLSLPAVVAAASVATAAAAAPAHSRRKHPRSFREREHLHATRYVEGWHGPAGRESPPKRSHRGRRTGAWSPAGGTRRRRRVVRPRPGRQGRGCERSRPRTPRLRLALPPGARERRQQGLRPRQRSLGRLPEDRRLPLTELSCLRRRRLEADRSAA